ncbi:MAG: exonuclease domain-containing protein [Bacteroidales bacterium]|jgi:DNA polymerase-3 subunit epsilon
MNLKLSKPLAFIDLETTGINVTTDRIIELSIFKVGVDYSTETITYRINPTIPIPIESTKIHGIIDEDIKDCPAFSQLAAKINNILSNCDIAGYNSNKFDIPILIEEFYRTGIDFDISKKKFVDVQNIFHKMEQRNLIAAYKFYCNKELQNAHSAEADAKATYEVFASQLEKYDELKNKDINFLHDFSCAGNFADLVGRIAYNENGIEIFNFGKHKGKLISEVLKKEPSYYNWMMNSDFPISTKRVLTAIKLRDFNK